MISELNEVQFVSPEHVIAVKVNEVIRALNAIEAASTSTNSRVMQMPPFEECVIELRRIYDGNISVHEIGVIRDVYDFIIGRQQA